MERRSCSLGCIVAGLGLVLTLCLAPYLISSAYSIFTAILNMPAASNWLWGDWLNSVVGESDRLYMVLAEGPICCVGAMGLLIFLLGLMMVISGRDQEEEYDLADEEVFSEEM